MRSNLTACMALFGLLVLPVLPASAQLWANNTNNQQLMFEDGNFNHFAADNPRITQELMSNPNLIHNPSYLAAHPQLVNFMNKYPQAAASMRANPQAFLHQDVSRTTGNNYNAGGYHDPNHPEYHHHHHDEHWHY